MVNCFTLVTPTFDPLGLSLHPLPALLNHSCDYNSVVRYGSNGLHLEVIPMRKIRKDEEIKISYVDTTHPYRKRQDELRERYFFNCECPKCLSESANLN